MDSQDTQVLAAAQHWAAAGHRFTLITVARTWGSAPRPPGAWMVLRDESDVEFVGYDHLETSNSYVTKYRTVTVKNLKMNQRKNLMMSN